MTDKELIKEEIEKQKSFYQRTFDVLHPDDLDATIAYAHMELLDRLLQFIDSIPEEPASEDLEEAAEQYAYEEWPSIGIPNTVIELAFKAGAEWQRNQMKEAIQTEYEKGRFDMREEMMKMAEDTAGLSLSWGKDSKTKIIIIEEEQL